MLPVAGIARLVVELLLDVELLLMIIGNQGSIVQGTEELIATEALILAGRGRLRHIPVFAWLVTVVLVTGFLSPPPASADGAFIDVVGTTTIVAKGNGGTRIRVPKDSTLTSSDMLISVDEGTFAYVALSRRDNCSSQNAPLCIHHTAVAIATPGWNPGIGTPLWDEQIRSYVTPLGGELFGTDYDVYVVTDGTASLVMRFDEVPAGGLTIPATGRIDAVLDRLGPECPADAGCDVFGYGHATHAVASPGYVASVAVAYQSGVGYRTVSNCIDPWLGVGPPKSDDTVLGCPALPGEGDGDQSHVTTLAQAGGAWVAGSARLSQKMNHNPDGPVRVGYTGTAFGVPSYGHSGYGVWLSGGIDSTG